jgi:hypothetical protein
MQLRFADLGPSGLARRFAVVDEPVPAIERLEVARQAVTKVAAPVTKSVTKSNHRVTKPNAGRKPVHETAADR